MKVFDPFKIAVFGIIFIILVEVAARQTGMVEFPLYMKDEAVGYIPKPNQHGSFMMNNDWMFNQRSMGTTEFKPGEKFDILLIGDSIVMGGNPIAQKFRLAPQMEAQGKNLIRVWPVSAASWSSQNAAAYLKKNADILPSIKWVVWVLNSGDFSSFSTWQSNRTQPLQPPFWATWYLFDKYVWAKHAEPKIKALSPLKPKPLPAPDAVYPQFEQFVREFRAQYPNIGLAIVWFPAKYEIPPSTTPEWALLTPKLLQLSVTEKLLFIDVSRSPLWKGEYYRDSINPDIFGYPVLARLIMEGLRTASRR